MEAPSYKRIESIDLLRGLVMVIMALDHSREFMHSSVLFFSPTDPERTTGLLFATRWITHFCAPVFFMLAGVSAGFSGRKRSKRDLSLFLVKRGLWLVLIDITIITFVWTLDCHFDTFYLAVLSALGLSMIMLAGILHMDKRLILIFSLAVIAGHNLLDGLNMHDNILLALLHSRTSFVLPGNILVGIDYPIVPWVAVMSLGYWLAGLYDKEVSPSHRRKILALSGAGSVVLFILLRLTDFYGDPLHRELYSTSGMTIMSFMDLTKYPPSLLYLLATLGPSLLFLAYSEKLRGKLTGFFTVFGRVPFFFYIIHLYTILVISYVAHHLFNLLQENAGGYEWILKLTGYTSNGFGLGFVWFTWILIIVLTYPLCRFYDRYKARHKDRWWLSYL